MNLTAFKDPNITNLNHTCLGNYYAPLIKRVLIADRRRKISKMQTMRHGLLRFLHVEHDLRKDSNIVGFKGEENSCSNSLSTKFALLLSPHLHYSLLSLLKPTELPAQI